jgi:hypothetical protein
LFIRIDATLLHPDSEMIVICSAGATKPVSHLMLSSDLREQDNRSVGYPPSFDHAR